MARIGRRSARKAGRSGSARRGRRGAILARSLTAFALLPLASRLPTYGRLTLDLLADGRVSVARKALLATVVGYAVSPLDLIPDRIPFLGALDELDRLGDTETLVAIPAIDWTWPPRDVNAILRAILERVDLGPDLRPVSAVWRNPELRR